ncbi:hypothetical protein THRCLA_04477 [Thraustotheca clavata]|uniref:Chromo domain-containing protein n=1 Tax=Thraustotheca clavata TaxID=74557 RepID=A0A1V9ZYX5_9STRA|nr:hypothetical protein THRCLA_04477 [Thraustotheca clavata]
MAAIERILERKVERGRVHYLVRWKDHSQEHDTWESRIDLKNDGHFSFVQAFEAERKASMTDEDVQPRGRSKSSKSPSRPRSKSKSSPRSRSKTRGNSVPRERRKNGTSPSKTTLNEQTVTKELTETEPKQIEIEEKPVENLPKVIDLVHETPVNVFAPVARSLPVKHNQDNQDIFNNDAVQQQIDAISSGEYNNLSKMFDALQQQGWLYRFIGFIGVFIAMLATVLVPEIEKSMTKILLSLIHRLDFAESESTSQILAILSKSNMLPPFICLVLVLYGNSTKSLSKWIAVCLVWRTAAEVVLQLPSSDLYSTIIQGCFIAADLSSFVAVCACCGGSQDVFTQTLCVMGFILLVISDSIMVWDLLPMQSTRFLVMSFGSILLSLSSVLAEASSPTQQV